jgi:cellulose synthase/poly-beta-1,6-N-acetylglucosamine synthase-like glycosyltransferase
MSVLLYLFIFIQLLLAAYILQPAFLLLIYGLRRLFLGRNRIVKAKITKEYSFAVIVTAHKNLQLVPPLVDSVLQQTYANFMVYVVADNCENTDIGYNDHPKVRVLKPEVPLNAKIRSIDFAINNFSVPHDVMIILDADNLVHPDYLAVLNRYFNRGYRAVQTNMLAKNNDSVYAQLDAAGNYFYNFIDRKMRMELGLSSNIWGLGIALETSLYKEVIYQNFLGGFDKKIQADIVKLIPQLAYAEDAKVYDEKIDSGDAMETQRTRWINAYFKYFTYGWDVFSTGIRKGNFNLVFFGFNLLRPPLFLQISAAMLFAVLNYWIAPAFAIGWVAAIGVFALSFLLIVAVMSTDRKTISALFYLPVVFFRQLRAFLHIGRANKAFLQTQNNKVIYISDLLSKEG